MVSETVVCIRGFNVRDKEIVLGDKSVGRVGVRVCGSDTVS